MGHNNNKPGFEPGTVSRSRINPRTNRPFTNARELLARDIRELRRVYPDIPNSKLKELIDLNKKDVSRNAKNLLRVDTTKDLRVMLRT